MKSGPAELKAFHEQQLRKESMTQDEKAIVDAASPRVQAILLGTHESGPSLAPPAKPARATRSDKGTKKGPKVEAAVTGRLSLPDVLSINAAYLAVDDARAKVWAAQRELSEAISAKDELLLKLTK